MYKLIIQDDEGKTTVVPLIREELTIGRQDGNTIRLTERNVSRRHAKLLRDQESIMIEDLDSYNGVRVNGTRIQGKVSIKEADRVQIGDYLIEVKAEQAASASSEQPTQEFAQIESPVPVVMDPSGAATVPTPSISAAGSGEIDVAAIEAAAAPTEEVFPRMVVLSTAMAGREFALNKPAMVIGRTEENDLWINHRSVSQHHAKIVREGENFTIVDLQSSNGVRVNGEDYGKVELRRGDLVDLGHVRMRFVAADEDFVFGRDAHAIDIGDGGKGKGIWIALLLLLVGIGAFVMFGRGGDGDKTTSPVTNVAMDASAVAQIADKADANVDVAVVVADAATETANNDTTNNNATNNDGLANFLAAAVEARSENNWEGMKSNANSALGLDPTNIKALEYRSQAEFESGNEENFEKFQLAVGKLQYAKVALYYEQVDEASVYKSKARADHDRVRAKFRSSQLKYAQKMGKRGDCGELNRQAAQVPDEWPEIRDAIKAVSCKASVANNKPNNTNNNKPNNPTNNKDPEPTMTQAEASALVKEASAAVRNKQFGVGARACKRVLKVFPGNAEAISTCAMAACNMKQSQVALRYVRRLKGARKAGVIQICTRLSVPGFGDE